MTKCGIERVNQRHPTGVGQNGIIGEAKRSPSHA